MALTDCLVPRTGTPSELAAIEADHRVRLPNTPLVGSPERGSRASRRLPLLERPLPDRGGPPSEKIWLAIDRFNGAVSRLPGPVLEAAVTTASQLFGPINARIVGVFAAADLLANRHQRKARRFVTATYLCLGLTLLTFALVDLRDPAIAGFLVLLLVVAYLVWASGIRTRENYYLDCRALAEGLRVLGFWRAAGIGSNVSAKYLAHHLAAIDWIRVALIEVERAAGDPDPAPPGSVEAVRTKWVKDQLEYFRNKVTQVASAGWSRTAAMAMMVATVGLTLVYVVAVVINVPAGDSPWPIRFLGVNLTAGWSNGLQALIAGAGGLGVALEAYSEKQGIPQLRTQYQLARDLFQLADDQLEAGYPAEDVFRQLGEEALRENGEWLTYHRNHPVDLRL
jgi:hypothetical protein